MRESNDIVVNEDGLKLIKISIKEKLNFLDLSLEQILEYTPYKGINDYTLFKLSFIKEYTSEIDRSLDWYIANLIKNDYTCQQIVTNNHKLILTYIKVADKVQYYLLKHETILLKENDLYYECLKGFRFINTFKSIEKKYITKTSINEKGEC